MAEQHGKAGRSTYWLSVNRGLIASFILIGTCGLLYAVLRQVLPSRGNLMIAALIVLVLAGVPFLLAYPFKKRSDRAERGADAEHTVGRALKALPDSYHVIHDLTFEGFNIDHVVIGPTGIFPIETKSQAGRVRARNDTLLLNGQPSNAMVDQTWVSAYTIRDLLQRTTGKVYPIHPILCFPNAYIEVRHPVKGIVISSRPFLRKAILYRHDPPHLSEDEVKRLANLLSLKLLPTKWRPLVV